MRVWWLMALGVAVLTSCTQLDAHHKNEIISHTLAVTVQVSVERADGSRRSGSGENSRSASRWASSPCG